MRVAGFLNEEEGHTYESDESATRNERLYA